MTDANPNRGNSLFSSSREGFSSSWQSCKLFILVLLTTILGATGLVQAQSSWSPNKPIRLVIPYPPGGATDVAARALVQKIGNSFGQPIIVENRAGANGMIASEVVFNSPADGYTLLVATADTNSINPNVYTKMSYQAREFKAVAPVAKVNFVLVGRPGLKVANLTELVTLAKNSNLSFASWGVGSTSQVAMEMFKARADLKILHVPFQGAAPAFQAVMAGQVDIMMAPATIVIPALSRVQAFGIASPGRLATAPQIPSLTEQGYPVDADAWVGILAPPKTPQPVLEHLYKHVNAATSDPEMGKRLQEIGLSSLTPAMSLDQFGTYMVSEIDRWGHVIRNAGIKLDN